ncbi:hypothetical protein INS49_015036 [Diaporthe citri]|uniref:uncharacterized protein n=1 Tax=Diaporthe citri TaxID=83186 RepID=UPI001C81E535|nr:uncharacterized protein INS49_015036 [Diaporthe citri]KAG6357159.1 hypothetical protein INS49_015036 [Diaporthe citri]
MYVPLQVEARFWFRPRVEVDGRVSPSPSIQALKIVRDTNKKHLGFIAQHEKKLLQRIDREGANQIYMQFGLDPPKPGEDQSPESSNEDVEPYRRGDLEPITVVGLRSHHHPVAQIRAQALATWQTMRDDYYRNQHQAAGADSPSWVVQDDNAFSEAAIWTIQETPGGEEPTDSSTSASASSSASDCDYEYTDDDYDDSSHWDLQGSDWSDGEDETDPLGEHRSPELSGSGHWLTEIPTPPPSDKSSPPPSPVLPESQMAPTTGVSDNISSTDSLKSDNSGLSAREELSRVLNDRKIMEAFLKGIVKRIKESYMSKSEKEAEKAYERQKYRASHRKGQKPRGEERADPKRALRFHRTLTMSPEQAEQHKLEEVCKTHFETHFQMTHHYEDAEGRVYAEPVATKGLPPENKFEWMKALRKQQFRF